MAATKSKAIEVITPGFWAEACDHLARRDRVMKRVIPLFGDACLESRGDAFVTLARSIVGQQISVKAAQSVWNRFEALPRRMTAANVLKLKVDDMRAAGLSARKVEYLVDLALHFDSGRLRVNQWQRMDDEAILAELVAIRGIGRWTVEMMLMFRLGRPDVLPIDDLGVRKGAQFVDRQEVMPTPKELLARGEKWGPYRTYAAQYLWRIADFGTEAKTATKRSQD